MTEPIHIISLGAGVQSSTMALMAAHGDILPMPAGAIFADTKAEPASVYRWLDWLEKQLPFPVYRVTQGSIVEALLTVKASKIPGRFWTPTEIPAYLTNRDGTQGINMRQCTHDFKLAPIMRQARLLIKQHGTRRVVQWIGISMDEAHRMKPSRVRYATNRWPLIDAGMKRGDCLKWMEAHGYPKPPRSSCVFCPYHSDKEWRRLRDEEPEEFAKAVKFESDLQHVKSKVSNFKATVFLHKSRVNLDQVDFSTDVERGQGLLWGNECEGMCGV